MGSANTDAESLIIAWFHGYLRCGYKPYTLDGRQSDLNAIEHKLGMEESTGLDGLGIRLLSIHCECKQARDLSLPQTESVLLDDDDALNLARIMLGKHSNASIADLSISKSSLILTLQHLYYISGYSRYKVAFGPISPQTAYCLAYTLLNSQLSTKAQPKPAKGVPTQAQSTLVKDGAWSASWWIGQKEGIRLLETSIVLLLVVIFNRTK
jgi:hypothetical protein